MSKCARYARVDYYSYADEDYADYDETYKDDYDAYSSGFGAMEKLEEMDWFCWVVEGVLIMAFGCVGLAGNSLSLVIFSRQKVHRIFHNLLLTLTIFDMVSLFL